MDYAVTNSSEYHLPRRGTLIMKHSELLDADFIKPDPIIDEILVEEGITLLTGTDNTGKSPLATQMGICIAMGIPFLGYSVPEPRKVLIYQFENPNGEHKARMVMQDGYFKKTYPEKAYLLGHNLYHRIIEEERDFINHWDKINDTLSEHPDLKVLVVDNLYTSTNVNISDNHELIKLLSDINQTVRKHNVALILLAHHVKKDKDLTELDKFLIRGGKSLTDFCSNVLQIHTSSLNEELRLFKITKIRILHDEDGVNTKMVPQLITIDHKHFIAHSRTVTTCEAVHFNTSDKSKELEAVMLWHGYNDAPFTTNEWVNNVVHEQTIWSEATAKRRLNALVKWGWLKKLSYGKYQVNWKAVNQASKYDKK
jgi:RecA-family ATPase